MKIQSAERMGVLIRRRMSDYLMECVAMRVFEAGDGQEAGCRDTRSGAGHQPLLNSLEVLKSSGRPTQC